MQIHDKLKTKTILSYKIIVSLIEVLFLQDDFIFPPLPTQFFHSGGEIESGFGFKQPESKFLLCHLLILWLEQ